MVLGGISTEHILCWLNLLQSWGASLASSDSGTPLAHSVWEIKAG